MHDLIEEQDQQAFLIPVFCERNGISLAVYYRLQREGRGPRVMRLGTGTIRISKQAEADWQRAREMPDDAEARLIERQKAATRRRAISAGKVSALSPKHVSKRQQKKNRRR
ncbi:MAG: hypothetical protein V4559_08385 [Pseudomonadota bacterium]